MRVLCSFAVTRPDDVIDVRMVGRNHDIPVLAFGNDDDSRYEAELMLNSLMLTPAEQAAWLRRLSSAALTAASMIEVRAAMPADELRVRV